MTNDIIDGLQKIRKQVFERLMLNPDYRTLCTLDKTITDILAIGEASAAPAPALAPAPSAARLISRKETTTQETSAVAAEPTLAQTYKTPIKLNAARLFPTHRVA